MEKDRDALRFLWFENDDYNCPIEENRWTKWCFGLCNAPCASGKAFRKTGEDNVVNAPAEVVKINTTIRDRTVLDFLP